MPKNNVWWASIQSTPRTLSTLVKESRKRRYREKRTASSKEDNDMDYLMFRYGSMPEPFAGCWYRWWYIRVYRNGYYQLWGESFPEIIWSGCLYADADGNWWYRITGRLRRWLSAACKPARSICLDAIMKAFWGKKSALASVVGLIRVPSLARSPTIDRKSDDGFAADATTSVLQRCWQCDTLIKEDQTDPALIGKPGYFSWPSDMVLTGAFILQMASLSYLDCSSGDRIILKTQDSPSLRLVNELVVLFFLFICFVFFIFYYLIHVPEYKMTRYYKPLRLYQADKHAWHQTCRKILIGFLLSGWSSSDLLDPVNE